MPLPPEIEQRFENGATHARVDFEENWHTWSVRDVAEWWRRWCRRDVIWRGQMYNGTNHDRLGKILMDVTGVKTKPNAGVEISPDELKEMGYE